MMNKALIALTLLFSACEAEEPTGNSSHMHRKHFDGHEYIIYGNSGGLCHAPDCPCVERVQE